MVGGAQRRPAETGQWRHKKRRKLNKGGLQQQKCSVATGSRPAGASTSDKRTGGIPLIFWLRFSRNAEL